MSRFYIIDNDDGEVTRTDDAERANILANGGQRDCNVIDTQTNVLMGVPPQFSAIDEDEHELDEDDGEDE